MRTLLWATVLALLTFSQAAVARTYNNPTTDGHVTVASSDWDADELAFSDPPNDNRWGASDGDLVDLYVTWNADSLYVGLTTVNGPGGFGNGYVLFIDTDAQNGITGATDFTSANFYARKITFSTMGADVVMGGWNLPVHFDVKHCSDPTATTPVEGVHTQCNPGWKHVEAALSWNGLYGLGAHAVPPGTTLRFIATVVGGDGSGAYDALPTSSTGVESNPGTSWDASTDLDRYQEVVVDGDGNGVPDEGYPPSGSISGTVTLDDPNDHETVVTVTAASGGAAVRHTETPAGGGPYTITLLPDGTYDVTATALSYLSTPYPNVQVVGGGAVTGIDFALERVNGAIEGSVALSGGPALDVTVTAYDAVTGAVGGDGPKVVAGGTGAFAIRTVLDGTYRVEAVAKGFVEEIAQAVVANEDTARVGLLTLPVVVATKYSFVDDDRNTIYGTGTTVSLPDESVYYYAKAWVEPRDDGDRVAYWDAGAQNAVLLSATKLDPAYPTSGTVVFASPDSVPLPGSLVTSAMFDDGRAPFLVADDAVEVLRVLASKDSVEGVLEVGIDVPAPAKLGLTTDATTIEAGTGVAHIVGQLRDASGNPARVPDVAVSMQATGVGGQFSLSAPQTDPNGHFELDFSGTVAGTARVTAVLATTSPYAGIAVDTLTIVLEPGPASVVALSSNPAALRAGDSATVTARVLDAWGNAVADEGLSIALEARPSDLVVSLESPIVTDADGVATGALAAGTRYGVIEISGQATGISVESIYVPIDALIVAIDEQAPESDPAHNSNAGIDLTIMRAANAAQVLVVGLDFSSNFDGAHLALLLDTHGDAAGGTSDPFGFPVNYGHPLLPDYCFTYKYAAADYGDLRRFLGGQWEHYDFANREWRIGYADGVNAVTQGYVTKTADQVIFTIPFEVIEAAAGDTIRLEAYVMQETDGQKRAALDSTPADATHDMLPDTGEWWETATTPVTLTNYANYVVREDLAPPLLSDGLADPAIAEPGDLVTYTVRVTDGGDGIGDVFLDLSDLGGSALTRMLDDGVAPDAVAADGIYSAADSLGTAAANGEHTLNVTAKDAGNVWRAYYGIELTVVNPPVVLRRFDDDEGDDHGPNHTDASENPVQGLYYYYPTNLVFLPGSFDLTKVEVFADGDWIVFRTYIGDLVNHQDPGAANWGAPNPSVATCPDPYRTDLNIQKLDIYIDASEGEGATSGFPSRYVDIAAVDAWDYGISVEGWGKWFVVSNGANSQASWTLSKNDSDIQMCDNYADDWIDVRVDKNLFGQDLGADLANIANWDIIVTLSSHDGNTSDQNLGGIRWVNANTSEWQVGGGRDSENGRDRDANVIDVAVSHGEGKEPGRTQSEMLDYTTTEAEARFAANQTACVLEASFALDTSPPLVTPFPRDREFPTSRGSRSRTRRPSSGRRSRT